MNYNKRDIKKKNSLKRIELSNATHKWKVCSGQTDSLERISLHNEQIQ